MITLGIDTCFGACSVAITDSERDGESAVLAHDHVVMVRGHAEALMPMLDRALRDAGAPEISRIGVTCGPGTFTGTRVGLAAARALALAWGVPAVGVGTLHAMAGTAKRTRRDLAGPMAVIHDARRGQVYFQVFESGGDNSVRPLGEAAIAAFGQVERLMPSDLMAAVGSGASVVPWHDLRPKLALPALQPDALDVCATAAETEPDQSPARPIYLRPPDAKPQTGFALTRQDGP